jgi:hypothetical protein
MSRAAHQLESRRAGGSITVRLRGRADRLRSILEEVGDVDKSTTFRALAARRATLSLGFLPQENRVETNTSADVTMRQLAQDRRQRAIAILARTKSPSAITLQIPVWFALFVALLIAFAPIQRTNLVPYVTALLAFAIASAAVVAIRTQRRLEAVVQFVTQELDS